MPEATQRISDNSRAKTGVSFLTALPQLLSPTSVSPAAPSTELGTPHPLGNLPREVMWGDGEQHGLCKPINPGLNPGSVT